MNFKNMVMSRFVDLLVIVLVVLVSSCRSNDSNSENRKDYDNIEISAKVGQRKIFYRFPAPNDIISYIKSDKLSYKKELLSQTEYADKYIDNRLQYFNLGVYSADVAFITVFKTLSEAGEYFNTIEKLSYDLGLSPVFNDNMINRIRSNQNNIDSLSNIARESYINMVKHLTNIGNERELSIISAGGYVEVIYLATAQVDDIEANAELVRKIYDQRYGLENLIQFMNDHVDSPWMEMLQKDLINIYDNLELYSEKENNQETRSSSQTNSTNQANYEQLKKVVGQVRTKYTSPY